MKKKKDYTLTDNSAEAGQFGALAQALKEFEVTRDIQLIAGGHGERHTIVRQSSSADLPSQEDDAPGSLSQVNYTDIMLVQVL